MPQIKQLLAELVVLVAPPSVDHHHCADLIIRAPTRVGVSVRMRRPGYADKYPGEITIRFSRPTGSKTEHQKMMDDEDQVGWMFYGHTNAQEQITHWVVVDYQILKDHLDKALATKRNPDGTCFKVFNTKDLYEADPQILIALYPRDYWKGTGK